MLHIALLIATAAICFYAGYRLLHWLAPSWGTVLANVLASVGMLVDFSAQLPWGSILDSKEAAIVAFTGAAIGNILARLNGKKSAVGSP
jgi:hypothetical protein